MYPGRPSCGTGPHYVDVGNAYCAHVGIIARLRFSVSLAGRRGCTSFIEFQATLPVLPVAAAVSAARCSLRHWCQVLSSLFSRRCLRARAQHRHGSGFRRLPVS